MRGLSTARCLMQMFLNADFIESIHGRYNQTTEEKSDDGDGDDLEAA